MVLCIYGGADVKIDKRYIEDGEKLGRLIAEHGHSIVYGAGATGLMGAVSRGVHEKGGKVVGVVPKFFTNEEVLNKECDELIRTETMRERKQIMEERADAFIITPGGVGTYDEFFEILTLRNLNRHDKKIAILNTDGFYNKLSDAIDYAIDNSFIKRNIKDYMFTDVEKLLDFIEK